MAVVSAVNFVYFRLDVLLLSALSSPTSTAEYGLAYKTIEVLMSLPGFLLVAILPVLAREDGRTDRFSEVFVQSLVLMQVMAVSLAGFGLFGRELVVALGGQEFAEAGATMSLLLIAVGLMFVQNAIGYALVALGRQSEVMKISLCVLGANLALNVILIPLWDTEGAATALIVSETLYIVGLAHVMGAFPWLALLPSARLLACSGVYIVAMAAFSRLLPGGWDPAIVLTVAAAVCVPLFGALTAVTGVLPTDALRRGRSSQTPTRSST